VADSQRIEDLRRRVQKDPASIAFAQLAEECRRAGHYEEAVTVCRAGLSLHPGYLSARVTLGRALVELNELDLALPEFEQVLRSAPENLAAIRGLAEIHHRQGSLAAALAQYRAALALARNDPDLQQTVDELSHLVEPPPPPASADGMSLEQVEQEFSQQVEPPPPMTAASYFSSLSAPPPDVPAPAVAAAPVTPTPVAAVAAVAPVAPVEPVAPIESVEPVEPPEDVAARERALKTVAVLEQWLDAIHVARAQPRA
jgi:tetratricopeptide (TPR) repeat protein